MERLVCVSDDGRGILHTNKSQICRIWILRIYIVVTTKSNKTRAPNDNSIIQCMIWFIYGFVNRCFLVSKKKGLLRTCANNRNMFVQTSSSV